MNRGRGRPSRRSRLRSRCAARNLRKIYRGRAVVDDVDLELRPGEVTGLLGPNGAGKTTTFYIIVGFIRPDGGTVILGERDISRLPMHRRARLGIGYLPQEASIFRKMTVEENILAILETLPLSRAGAPRTARGAAGRDGHRARPSQPRLSACRAASGAAWRSRAR